MKTFGVRAGVVFQVKADSEEAAIEHVNRMLVAHLEDMMDSPAVKDADLDRLHPAKVEGRVK